MATVTKIMLKSIVAHYTYRGFNALNLVSSNVCKNDEKL